MSSEVWKVGQETKAEDYYKNIKEKGINGNIFLRSETVAVSQLTKVCQDMIDAYNEVIDDQNEYMVEIDDMVTRAENTANDIQERIKKLEEEIKALQQKEENGEITDEEKGKLSSKQDELAYLQGLAETNGKSENEEIKSKNEERKSEYRSKEKIATEYGNKTVEKGQPLADTKVSHGFFKKLFGATGKHKKEVGEKAVQTGNNLLDKVEESIDIQDKIDKKVTK